MKKLSIILVLINAFAFGQIAQDSLQNIAKVYFENQYVQKTFKDPYSYKLVKSWSEPVTLERSIKFSMDGYFTLINMKSFSKKEHKEFINKVELEQKKLNNLPQVEKEKVIAYLVFFDAYGANSYGNKVLGRYVMRIDTFGKVEGEVSKRHD